MPYKTVGILGGMGPEATAELYLRIIRILQQDYGAKYDADFPEIVILNLPLPDVVENATQEKEVEAMLVKGVKKLEIAGADFIAIPCNTVTYFLLAMQEAVSIPILSVVGETVKEVETKGLQKVGIIGTQITLAKNIYGKELGAVELITPDLEERKATTSIIMNVLAGGKNREDELFLLGLIRKMRGLGAEKVILGCTELPLLIRNNSDTIDTIEVLARAVVREATKDI